MACSDNQTRRLVRFQSFHSIEYLNRWFTIHVTNPEVLHELSLRAPHHRTYPILKFPCRAYLVEYDLNQRIRIWFNDQEVQVKKCSDYMDANYSSDVMQPCWVCEWVDINENWLIDPDEDIDESAIEKPDFYRLAGDRDVKFGDGGEAFLVYPVWIHERLPVSESRRQRLLDFFYKLNEKQKDFHPHPSPVQDIIDLAKTEDVPIYYELNKRSLGKAVGKSIKVAVVGVQSADGAHQQYKKLLNYAAKHF